MKNSRDESSFVHGTPRARFEAESHESCQDTAPLSVSVIIPVYNGGAPFRSCLASLKQAVPPPLEVIVVADGDTDGSGQIAEEWGARVLRFATPGGPARARNHGARAAHGDLLFFLDADVSAPTDVIEQVEEPFRNAPALAALIGSYDDEPAAPNFLSQYKNLFHHYVHQQGQEEAFTFWGACGAIRREVFFAVGGFDEAYQQPSIEDIELGYRLKQHGYHIRLCKSLQVKHWKRWDVFSVLKTDILRRAVPWTALLLQAGQLPNDLNIRIADRLCTCLVFLLLAALLGSWWWSGFAILIGLCVCLLLVLNAPLYRFFWDKRGLLFALQSIPWHWLYYWYSGLAFGYGWVRHLAQNSR